MIYYYYQTAIFSVGHFYIEAEKDLLREAESAISFLEAQLKDASPVARLVAQVILQRLSENRVYRDALEFISQIERETATTAQGAPSPEWVAERLYQDYGDSVAPLLGLHLVKLEGVWPSWKVIAVISYLGRLDSASSADALIELLVNTNNDQYLKAAVQAFCAIGDELAMEKLHAKLALLNGPRKRLLTAVEQIRSKIQSKCIKVSLPQVHCFSPFRKPACHT